MRESTFGTDLGVGHAGRINAPADDVDGLLDCCERPVVQSDGRQGHGDSAWGRRDDVEIGCVERTLRRNEGPEGGDGVLGPVRIDKLDQQLVVGRDDLNAVEDPLLDQRLAGRIDEAVQPLLGDGRHINLHEQIAAALEVEAEMDLAPRKPGVRATGQVRQAEKNAKKAQPYDQGRLGAAEIHHRGWRRVFTGPPYTRAVPGNREART